MGLLQQQFEDDPQNYQPTPPYTPASPTPTAPQITSGISPFTPPTAPKVGGGGGADVGFGGSFPDYSFKPVPKFDTPAFVRPDANSILSAPGFQARLKSGEDALQHSAASKGLLRSGGTFKDLLEYGQNFASNEYNNDFNQSLQTYGANYQLAKDKFAPLLAEWDTLSKADISKALAQYNRGTVWNNPNSGGGGGGGYSDPFPNPNIFGL